jgi:hypothetical protein
MDSKKQILSYIERTNNLLKSPSKKKNSLDCSAPSRQSPVKKVSRISIKSPEELTLKNSGSRSSSSKSSRSSAGKPYENSSLDFIKGISDTIDEFFSAIKAKAAKNAKSASKEDKILQRLSSLLEKEKKDTKPIQFILDQERMKKSLEKYTLESAEQLSYLEKKCKEITENNLELQKILDRLETKKSDEESINEETKKPDEEPIKKKSIHEILEKLSGEVQQVIEIKPDELLNDIIIQNYPESIDSAANKFINSIDPNEIINITRNLAVCLKSQEKSLEALKKTYDETLNDKKDFRSSLENKIIEYKE